LADALEREEFGLEWYQDAILPKQHERAIYSVSWSRTSGLLASAGSDGKIVVYKEQWSEAGGHSSTQPQPLTEWVVVAELFSAHDVFEINHVTWARRADKGKRWEGEEVLVSTGDEGEVRVWTLDEIASGGVAE